MSAHWRRRLYWAGAVAGGLLVVTVLGVALFQALPADPSVPATAPVASASPQTVGIAPTDRALGPGSLATTAIVATPTKQATTTVVEYAPERPGGNALGGSCWTNSLAVPSRNAWRCNVGAQTLDPCFELGKGEVVCNPNPLLGEPGVLVQLQEPLPTPDIIAEKTSSAWLLQLDDGAICNLATGATGLVGDKRITYVCSSADPRNGDQVVILGEPLPGPIWTAEKATLALRDGQFAAVTTALARLRAVVRGPAAFVPYACDDIAAGLGVALGADVQRAEAPFVDPVSAERGTACRVSIHGAATANLGQAVQRVSSLLGAWGWQEDARYRAFAAGQSTAGFAKASALCLLNTSQAEGQAAADLELDCVRERGAAAPEPSGRPQRITFAPGATADSLRGTLAAGEAKGFILRAFAGQTMIVTVTSPQGDVYLAIAGAEDRAPLLRSSANERSWRGKLPADQDYVIWIAARGEATTFGLDVVIPATLSLGPDLSVVAKGKLGADQSVHYVLSGPAEASVEVEVRLRRGTGHLRALSLADEHALVSSTAQATIWRGELAPGHAYLIEVFAADTPTDYELAVAAR